MSKILLYLSEPEAETLKWLADSLAQGDTHTITVSKKTAHQCSRIAERLEDELYLWELGYEE